jgi:flagellar basal body-associated protein FliL
MADPTPATKKGGSKKKIVYALVCLACMAAGSLAPMFIKANPSEKKEEKKVVHEPTTNLLFGEVVVNLAEERMSRYLRVKIVLKVVGPEDEKEGQALLAKYKPAMKSWLIAHLAGKSLKEVSGTAGVKKLHREILEKFEEMLEPEPGQHVKPKERLILKDVMFEEYVVQ